MPRAEASAAAELLLRTSKANLRKVGVDASYVMRGWAAVAAENKAGRWLEGPNGDLWMKIEGQKQSAKPFKVRSHSTLDFCKNAGVPIETWLGNVLADVAADVAHEKVKINQAYEAEAQK